MTFDFNRWIRQPSTLHGLGIVAAGIGAVLTHVATGNPHVDAVVAGVSYALVHLGIDDHSVAEQAVSTAAHDLLTGAPVAQTAADVASAVSQVAPMLAQGTATHA